MHYPLSYYCFYFIPDTIIFKLSIINFYAINVFVYSHKFWVFCFLLIRSPVFDAFLARIGGLFMRLLASMG